MKKAFLLSIVILLSALPSIAQEKVPYAYEVRIDGYYTNGDYVDLTKESISERTILLYPPIDLSEGGTYKWGNITLYIRKNETAVYQYGYVGEGPIGAVTKIEYEAVLLLELSFYDTIEEKSYEPELFAFECEIDGEKLLLDEPLKLGDDGKPEENAEIMLEGEKEEYYVKKGSIKVYEDEACTKEVGTLISGYRVRSEDVIEVHVKLSTTGEPVQQALVRFGDNIKETDAFGKCSFSAPFVEDIEAHYIEASKEYGTNTTVRRSIYGKSDYPVVVIPYDLSEPSEVLAWLGHFALTQEAQAMYEAAEILGEWGADLGTEGVTVWSNIFGPKGGSLAKFIRDFPQFMVDRGKALEATQNMLDTIWALFTLVPAFVLASPQLLQTAPMRMLQFWPALFINLDLVLDGISQLVIDLGVFMTSLGPSVLMLLPDIFNQIPEAAPQFLNTFVMALQALLEILPAAAQYVPAIIAALPAFGTQMLQALFYNAPGIIDVLMSESYNTIKNLFRSWPMFPIGCITGLLAVAPALMSLPAYPVYSVVAHTLENFFGSLSTYMQQLREMPSQLLDSCIGVFRIPGFIPNCLLGMGWAAFFSFWFLPVLLISAIGIIIAMLPALLLSMSIWAVPLTAIAMVMCGPLCWPLDVVLGLWMILSAALSWLLTVPATLGDMIDEFFLRAAQVFKLIGYPIGWIKEGVEEITGMLGGVEDELEALGDQIDFERMLRTLGAIIGA